MNIDDYFARVGIEPKSVEEVAKELTPIDKNCYSDDELYFEEAYRTGRDIAEHCIDYEQNKRLYEAVAGELGKENALVVEPGCGSGILGCYLALNTGLPYVGIDKSEEGIKKARALAKRFGLPENMFINDDFRNFPINEENIVTGRFNIINGNWEIDHELIGDIARQSDRLYMIQAHNHPETVEKIYENALGKHGYVTTPLTEVYSSRATERHSFAFMGDKKI